MPGKIIIDDNISLTLLQQKINEKAGRFVVFSYCIGLGFVTLKRMSPAIFIQKEEDFLRYKKHYNRLNYFFGFMGVPYGWMYAPGNIISNNKGGIDVTEDVMLNITEVSLLQKKIEFKKTSMIFDFPDKNDEKIFRKHFEKAIATNQNINRLAVGWYLNCADPFYIIGIDASDFYENHIDNLKKYLYSDFFKRVQFHFIDISDSKDALKDEILVEYLLKQGLVVDKKQKHEAV